MTILTSFYQQIHSFFKKDIKKPFLIIFLVFFIIILLGTLFFYQKKDLTIQLMGQLSEMIKGKDLMDSQGNIRMLLIFKNNLQAATFSILLGILPLLFLNFLPLLINAITLAIAVAANLLAGSSMIYIVATLLPHGILEIPAILLSITLGYYLCKELLMKLLGERKEVSLVDTLRFILQFYIGIILPLLFVAAIIESYVTPWIIQLVL